MTEQSVQTDELPVKLNLVLYHNGSIVMGYRPEHFVKLNKNLTRKQVSWIMENCSGRIYIENNNDLFSFDDMHTVFFEDPKDIVYFNLIHS